MLWIDILPVLEHMRLFHTNISVRLGKYVLLSLFHPCVSLVNIICGAVEGPAKRSHRRNE